MNKEDLQSLETLMDRYSATVLLEGVAEVVGQKAAHVAEHWQDTTLAKQWMALEMAITAIIPNAEGL